jgi:dTDP-4-dehydrorhamnose reductase
MQRPILLVGSSGQVGRELQRTLVPLGDVIAASRSSGDIETPAASIALDLTDVSEVRRAVRAIRPSLIVNAAAYTDVDRAETEIEAAEAVNAIAPGVLAEEAQRAGAALVHYSTDYIFDGSGRRPWREEDPAAPLNVYGRTKLAGEVAVQRSGAAHLILRIAWIYSPHGRNFVKTMLRLAAERSEVRVVSDQMGAPTSARRVAAITAQILAQAGDDPVRFFRERGGALHVGAAGEATWRDVAIEVFRLARDAGLPVRVGQVVPIATAEYRRAALRPLNSRLDCSRLRERFCLEMPHWKRDLADQFDEIAAAIAPCA